MQANNKSKIKKRIIILSIIILVLGIAFSSLYFVRSKAREESDIKSCMSVQRWTNMSIAIYFQYFPNENIFQVNEDWITKYGTVEAICPNFKNESDIFLNGSGLNENLDGIKYSNLTELKDVVLIADTDNTNNLISSANDIAIRHFKYKGLIKEYGTVVTYCDGRSEFVSEKDIKNLKFTAKEKR